VKIFIVFFSRFYFLFILLSGCNIHPKNQTNEYLEGELQQCPITICDNINSRITFDSAEIFLTPQNLSKVSAVTYLNFISNFSCYDITIPACRFPKNWIRKENLNSLIKISNNPAPCSKLFIPSTASVATNRDSFYIPASTIGQEAVRLINSYFLKEYPCPIIYSRDSVLKMIKNEN
jgi:hypothetical protein